MLVLVEGPAGGGKSQVTAAMLEAGEVELVADVTRLWVALSGARRGPDGRYPVRRDDDPSLEVARYMQAVVVRQALEGGADVAVTTSRRGQVARWLVVAEGAAAAFSVRTVDPGELVVRARLADPSTGTLSEACDRAVRRWYG